jgi:polyisoprenoid-binding protein YceI
VARIVRALVVVVVLLALGVGALFWFALRSDAPPEAALPDRGGSTTSAVGGATPDGTWVVAPGDDVFVGYRVTEVLTAVRQESAGRTGAVEGTMTVDGATIGSAEVTADVTQLRSDRERRDRRLRTDGLETDRFPTATFTLTTPIELEPPVEPGSEVRAVARGDLTLHGVTREVEITLDARWNGDTIDVAGSLPVEFSDFDIDPPNIGGFVQVEDHGTLELQLTFSRA